MQMSDVVCAKEQRGLRISSSNVGMESARSYQASTVNYRRFAIMDYRSGLAQDGNALNTAVKDSEEETKEKSGQAAEEKAAAQNDWQSRFGMAASRTNLRSSAANTVMELRQITIRYIFDILFASRRGRLNDWARMNGWSDTGSSAWGLDAANADNGNAAAGNAPDSAGKDGGNAQEQPANDILGLFTTNMKVFNFTQESYFMEQECTSFSTVGTVRTSDGREINFNVNVGMSREFEQYYRSDLQLATFTMCDPLVINLDTDVAGLSDQTFYFDIDADGELDEVSQLGGGSGYLALDKNGDGVINDGSELFGTASGNGFADLAEYDEDGNGWIDENDAIWSKLKIWVKDENGNDVLYRLADKGVGAICLQNVSTDFTLKGDEGRTQGAVRNTGIFLYENGNVGTVQHVDVAKYDMGA